LNEIEHFSKVSNLLILRILAEKSRENFETRDYLSPTFQHLTK